MFESPAWKSRFSRLRSKLIPPPIPPNQHGLLQSTQLGSAQSLLHDGTRCSPNEGCKGAQLPTAQHPALVTARQHQSTPIWATCEKNRPLLPLQAFRPLSPSSGSGRAGTGCKQWGQCSGHQFCSEAFQVGAGVWKGSACCIRQLSPAKVRAVLVRKCLPRPPPPPDPCSRLHTQALLQAHSNGEPTAGHCPSQEHPRVPKSPTLQQQRSTPKARCAEGIVTLGFAVFFQSLSHQREQVVPLPVSSQASPAQNQW